MTANADYGRVIEFDEDGTPLCPWSVGEYEWDEAGNHKTYYQVPCRAELALTIHLRITPGQGDPVVRRDEFNNKNAVTSAWEFGCINGHVVAVSCEDEDAEDFTWLADQMASHIGSLTADEMEDLGYTPEELDEMSSLPPTGRSGAE